MKVRLSWACSDLPMTHYWVYEEADRPRLGLAMSLAGISLAWDRDRAYRPRDGEVVVDLGGQVRNLPLLVVPSTGAQGLYQVSFQHTSGLTRVVIRSELPAHGFLNLVIDQDRDLVSVVDRPEMALQAYHQAWRLAVEIVWAVHRTAARRLPVRDSLALGLAPLLGLAPPPPDHASFVVTEDERETFESYMAMAGLAF